MSKTKETPEPEHWFVRGEGGSIFKLDLPLHESILERIAKGYIQRVANEDGAPYIEDAEPKRPALDAKKADWVGWAVHNGMTPDDAEALTIPDLIERFGVEKA